MGYWHMVTKSLFCVSFTWWLWDKKIINILLRDTDSDQPVDMTNIQIGKFISFYIYCRYIYLYVYCIYIVSLHIHYVWKNVSNIIDLTKR